MTKAILHSGSIYSYDSTTEEEIEEGWIYQISKTEQLETSTGFSNITGICLDAMSEDILVSLVDDDQLILVTID